MSATGTGSAAPFAEPIDAPRPPWHPLEAVLVAVTALHLCFLPWALGTMHPWSQFASLGLGFSGFLLAAIPRTELRDFSSGSVSINWPIARLLRFPVFWAGLALLAYIAVQGLNPAWRFFSNASTWWLEPRPSIAWLPSGVGAPFDRFNPWRALTVAGSLWLLICSVWAGCLRRKSYHALFVVLIANASLLALLAVLQKLTGAKRIFWSYVPSNDSFLGSFIYPNHAGPYLYLMVALAVGLAWRYYQRALIKGWTTLRARALISCGVFVGVAVLYSASRASILLMSGFALIIGATLVARRVFRLGRTRDHPEFLPLALGLAVVLGLGLGSLQAGKIWSRFSAMVTDPSMAARGRTIVRDAAVEMLQDRWVFGWGAGCFRHGFPLYAQKYPAIYHSSGGNLQAWEHAHNDWVQFPVELGVVGMLPILFMLGWIMRELVRRQFVRNAAASCAVLGCGLVFLHASVDFVFQNPAVLFTWSFLLIAAARWAELEPPLEPSAPKTRHLVP